MPEVMINGPVGRLEGRYVHSPIESAPVAIILHPHPEHGGTMHNKVVYALYQAFSKKGFSTLRFNFRGVGRSEGAFDKGEGELSDAASALDWLQTFNDRARECWVAGFSFGAWVGMQLLMRRPELKGFIAISPPANLYDFSFLAPCPTPGLVIQGRKDDIVSEPEVGKLVKKIIAQKGLKIDYRVIDSAGHFFNDELNILKSYVEDYLDVSTDRNVTTSPSPTKTAGGKK